jgi:predicted alpha/beta-hydrolase family hydrolase
MADPEELTIKVNERDNVTGLLYRAGKKNGAKITLVLGHGAGANQQSEFMRLFARGLAARGLDVLTFNFIYSEQSRSGPDPKARLESCYQAVIEIALSLKKLKGNKLAIGGKSMGGRIASQVAADDALIGTARKELIGLVFFGYPLHPPGRPDQLRDKHLKDVRTRMLFVQGTRDGFGTPEELREVIKRLRLPATLHLIEGGDHSFKVPKSLKVPQGEIYESIMDKTVDWLRSAPQKGSEDTKKTG